jgi:palmitoyltransferase
MGIAAHQQTFSVHTVLRSVGVLMQIAFLGVISNFFKFHVELVLSNSSTLDNLERQRSSNAGPNIYDITPYENFVQVFGTNSFLWFVPVLTQSIMKGNGVVWEKN